MDVQTVKDTFYTMLRDRVAAANAGRTVVVRGQVRPGVVVRENELIGGETLLEAFVLRWTMLAEDETGLVATTCEIDYATEGAAGGAASGGGMDRGRALGAMDVELLNALRMEPWSIAAGATGASVFWGDLVLKAATAHGGRMERTAEVTVYG